MVLLVFIPANSINDDDIEIFKDESMELGFHLLLLKTANRKTCN